MNFDQWMEEILKGTFFLRDMEDSNVLNRTNAFIHEDLEEEEPPSSELKKK